MGQSYGIEPVFSASDIVHFRRSFRGSLVLPNDFDYQRARAARNGMVDKRPAGIAYCTTPADVISALEFARGQKMAVAVRSGGHNIAGNEVDPIRGTTDRWN